MKYEIKFEKRAFQELNKLDEFIARRIFKDIKSLQDGFKSKDVKRLKGRDTYRLRVVNYRVLMEIDKNLIKIFKIGHRKNIYKK